MCYSFVCRSNSSSGYSRLKSSDADGRLHRMLLSVVTVRVWRHPASDCRGHLRRFLWRHHRQLKAEKALEVEKSVPVQNAGDWSYDAIGTYHVSTSPPFTCVSIIEGLTLCLGQSCIRRGCTALCPDSLCPSPLSRNDQSWPFTHRISECFTDEATPRRVDFWTDHDPDFMKKHYCSSLKATSLRNREQIQFLTQRVAALEEALASSQPSHSLLVKTDVPSLTSTAAAILGSEAIENNTSVDETIDIFGSLSLGEDGHPVYHGATSLSEVTYSSRHVH